MGPPFILQFYMRISDGLMDCHEHNMEGSAVQDWIGIYSNVTCRCYLSLCTSESWIRASHKSESGLAHETIFFLTLHPKKETSICNSGRGRMSRKQEK